MNCLLSHALLTRVVQITKVFKNFYVADKLHFFHFGNYFF